MRPPDEPERPFSEPWHAQLFAMTHALVAGGAFAWAEWSEWFAAALREADADGAPTDGSAYYDVWLSALERFLTARRPADEHRLGVLREAWADAYLRTPHGAPVELPAEA